VNADLVIAALPVDRITFQGERLRAIAASEPAVPLPGSGSTWARWQQLSDWSAENLSLGRLAEGHTDALAILAEDGRAPADSRAVYGVWAARSGQGDTKAERVDRGWQLTGSKPFCSGYGLFDRALVTAETPEGYRLFDLDVANHVVGVHAGSWQAVGMADSRSETLEFGGPPVPLELAVGEPAFYLDRPGFWFGAAGVAACWFGGAHGLVTHLTTTLSPGASESVLAAFGDSVAQLGALRSVLKEAAAAIDRDPFDRAGRSKMRAQIARQAVHHGATRILELTAAAAGARPLCHDQDQSQRAADLYVYLSQHHGLQEMAELGRQTLRGVLCP
jgi:hypothetical protein